MPSCRRGAAGCSRADQARGMRGAACQHRVLNRVTVLQELPILEALQAQSAPQEF